MFSSEVRRFLDGRTVGVDFGTAYSSLAELDANGDPFTLPAFTSPNDAGMLRTPSTVVLGEEGHVYVGKPCESELSDRSAQFVEGVKRQVGSKEITAVYQGNRLTAEFLAALILKKLKQDGEQAGGRIGNAVIAVPARFDTNARKAMRDAGRIATLNVVDLLAEPIAAVLAHRWWSSKVSHGGSAEGERTGLVFDLGAGACAVAVVIHSPRVIRVLAHGGDETLCGHDWTMRLADRVCAQLVEECGDDPRAVPESHRRIVWACELAKRELSQQPAARVQMEHAGKSLELSITREEFERITADLAQRAVEVVEGVLKSAGLTPSQLNAVIPVGGGTAMPAIGAVLSRLGEQAQPPGYSPEHAVAHGAAIHAGRLAREYDDEDEEEPPISGRRF